MFGIQGLTPEIFSVLGIIALTFALFVVEVVRVDVVACMLLVLLGITQLVPKEILFSGFSSDAVIALIGIMIIGRGLERAGVINAITEWILKYGQDKEERFRLLLMIVGGLLSGFMRSVGTVALFLPIVTRIRRTTGIAKTNLLLPLGFCAILGSTLTMVGTGPLILLNTLLTNLHGLRNAAQQPVAPFSLFYVFPIGLALLTVGVLYFWAFSKWLVPNVPKKTTTSESSLVYFERVYGIGGEFFEVKVPATSSLANKTLKQWEAILDPKCAILGIRSHGKFHFPPLRKEEIPPLSVLAIIGPRNLVEAFVGEFGLHIAPHLSVFKQRLNPSNAGLCEAVVPPSSPLVGRAYSELHMRKQFSSQVLAVLRGDSVRSGAELNEVHLRPGDALGMFCTWQALAEFESNPDFVVVTTDYPHERFYSDKAKMALFFAFVTVVLLTTTHISPALCLLLGAVGMVFTKVLSIDEAYESVSWKTVFLLAGLLPLGSAVELSGTSDWVTSHFLHWFEHFPILGIEVLLGVLAALFTLILSNVGATILLVPMAIDLADALGQDPRMFAFIVALNASNSFILPTHQANALISGPGRYRVAEYMKAGLPLTVIYLFVTILMLNIMF